MDLGALSKDAERSWSRGKKIFADGPKVNQQEGACNFLWLNQLGNSVTKLSGDDLTLR